MANPDQDANFTGGVVHIIDTVLTIPESISSTAVAAGLSGAVGALTRTNLAGPLDMMPDVTVFVPNNMAFESIGSALPNLSMSALADILQYHGKINHAPRETSIDALLVVNGTVGYSSQLTDDQMLPTLNGAQVTITKSNGSVFVNSAKVVTPDVLVANGVVHVIDK